MKSRSTNIEWIRIVAMLLIMISHFSFHGFNQPLGGYSNISNTPNVVFLRFFVTGNLGNALFMIITGYFLCKSQRMKISKLVSVVIQVLTYSLVCYIIYTVVYDQAHFRLRDVYVAATPLIHTTYWYFSSYVIVYLLHPYINRGIANLKQNELLFLIGTLVVIWGIIPDFLNVKFGRSDFLVFVFYYLIGSYIRLFVIEKKDNLVCRRLLGNIWSYLPKVLGLCLSLWLIVAIVASYSSAQLSDHITRLYRIGSPLTILFAITIFLIFLMSKEIKHSNAINTVASCIGGVYLIHDNPYVSSVLYTNVFHLERYSELQGLFLITIGFVVLTFVVCVIIEFVRKSIYGFIEKQVTKA